MLIIHRKIGESILISDNVEVKVMSARGNKVTLGIDAPRTVPVHRKEIIIRDKADAQTNTTKEFPKA